jgi:hypothetical protein
MSVVQKSLVRLGGGMSGYPVRSSNICVDRGLAVWALFCVAIYNHINNTEIGHQKEFLYYTVRCTVGEVDFGVSICLIKI